MGRNYSERCPEGGVDGCQGVLVACYRTMTTAEAEEQGRKHRAPVKTGIRACNGCGLVVVTPSTTVYAGEPFSAALVALEPTEGY